MGFILFKSSEDHITDILLILHLIFCTLLENKISMCLWCMKYSQRVAFQVCHIMYIFIYNYNNWNCAGKISEFHIEYLNIFYQFSLKIMSIVKTIRFKTMLISTKIFCNYLKLLFNCIFYCLLLNICQFKTRLMCEEKNWKPGKLFDSYWPLARGNLTHFKSRRHL